MSDATVPAIAEQIRISFPELEQRSFAIMEADVTKESYPNIPLCFVALLGIDFQNNSNNVSTPTDLLENIMIEFWLTPTVYKRNDGSASPFYAYQDYEKILNRLISVFNGYFTPKGKTVKIISMVTHSDELALVITFRVSVKWRWCDTDETSGDQIKFVFSVDPSDLCRASPCLP